MTTKSVPGGRWILKATKSRSLVLKKGRVTDKFRFSNVGFKIWAEKGLITTNQMFDRGTLKSFKQLQDKFGLLSNDFYRYLQVRNYLMSHKEWNMLKQPPTSIKLNLIKCIEEKSARKVVSNIYKCLQTHLSGNSLDIKERWEFEMNVIIEDDK